MDKFEISMIKPARRTKVALGKRVFRTALNIEILVIEIYLYFGACHLLFFKKFSHSINCSFFNTRGNLFAPPSFP